MSPLTLGGDRYKSGLWGDIGSFETHIAADIRFNAVGENIALVGKYFINPEHIFRSTGYAKAHVARRHITR